MLYTIHNHLLFLSFLKIISFIHRKYPILYALDENYIFNPSFLFHSFTLMISKNKHKHIHIYMLYIFVYTLILKINTYIFIEYIKVHHSIHQMICEQTLQSKEKKLLLSWWTVVGSTLKLVAPLALFSTTIKFNHRLKQNP